MDKLQRFIQIFFNNELITTVVPALAIFVIAARIAQKLILPRALSAAAKNTVNAVLVVIFGVSAFVSYRAILM